MALAYGTLDDLLALEPFDGGVDMFTVAGSPAYPWGRVYGGQVAAQGLWAAARTVDPEFAPHSVHAYFIRGGDSDQPILYEVDRIRDGRSFVTRRVVAHQSDGAILNLSASFQRAEPQADITVTSIPENIPPPEDCLPGEEWCPYLERRWVPGGVVPNGAAVWIRITGSDESGSDHDPTRSAAALTFMSDGVPTDAASTIHPQKPPPGDYGEVFIGASLDHAVWFHRQLPADQWQLHVMDGQTIAGARGLAFGQVFGLDGTHAASIAQEILIRERSDR